MHRYANHISRQKMRKSSHALCCAFSRSSLNLTLPMVRSSSVPVLPSNTHKSSTSKQCHNSSVISDTQSRDSTTSIVYHKQQVPHAEHVPHHTPQHVRNKTRTHDSYRRAIQQSMRLSRRDTRPGVAGQGESNA